MGCSKDGCEINGVCFAKGDAKDGDLCYICAPAQNPNEWTFIEGKDFEKPFQTFTCSFKSKFNGRSLS